MEEKYENKYKIIFEKGSNCTININPIFNSPVTFVNGEKGKKPHSKMEKISFAITSMIEEEIIKHKKNLSAICKVISDENIFPGIGYAGFIKLLKENCSLDENMLPNTNDLKADIIRGTYPEWKMDDSSDKKLIQYIGYANEFLVRFNSY